MVYRPARPARGGGSCEHFGGYKNINRIPLQSPSGSSLFLKATLKLCSNLQNLRNQAVI